MDGGAYNYWPNLRLAVLIEAMPIKKRVLLLQFGNNLKNMFNIPCLFWIDSPTDYYFLKGFEDFMYLKILIRIENKGRHFKAGGAFFGSERDGILRHHN